MKSNIDPMVELFKWGPIDARPIYTDTFVQDFVDFHNLYDSSWPDVIGHYSNEMILFIVDYTKLRKNGRILFDKYVMDEDKLKECYDKWYGVVKRLLIFEGKVNDGLSCMNDSDLIKSLIELRTVIIDFWHHGFMPELSNWGGEELLKQKILEFNKVNFIEIFEKLSAPEEYSFFQVEEMELLKIKLLDGNEQEEALMEHQKKYYWLRNNYGFTEVLAVDYFRKEIENMSRDEAEKKLNEIKEYPGKVKDEKKRIIEKYGISKEIVNIASKVTYCVCWQDLRKKYIFIMSHVLTCFVKEISKRKSIEFNELSYYQMQEIIDFLKNDVKLDMKDRFNGFVQYYYEREGVKIIEGDEANKFIKPYVDIEIDEDQKEIKGMVVSSGRVVKGLVKIIKTPRNMNGFEDGNVLVAAMTSPDFIVAMRKASAIVTDEGGMTCHAAIVSRELGIPCIVNTRIATKLLKDNDLVEVDADKGVVRKLN